MLNVVKLNRHDKYCSITFSIIHYNKILTFLICESHTCYALTSHALQQSSYFVIIHRENGDLHIKSCVYWQTN